MQNYIKNIKVNKIFHLQGLNIPIENENVPHLFITGKNGSGKTVLLNAISSYIEKIQYSYLNNTNYRKAIEPFESQEVIDNEFKANIKVNIANIINYNKEVYVELNNIADIFMLHYNNEFLFAHYKAYRKPYMQAPLTPEKPNLSVSHINEGLSSEFVKFLVDLKIQEALARNENQNTDAENIRKWFNNFEDLLRNIYGDNELKIEFNYKDYSFIINTDGKAFNFTELSDGYAAIIDIVADLILKMQNNGKSVTRAYEKRGVVMIDEIETHLHLELQKNIMPILTKVFPNIQFIVTTHSPFVLSSLSNAVAFDLEKKEIIDELNEYSYEALAEGYFGIKTSSSYLEMRLNEFRNLLDSPKLSDAENFEARRLLNDLDNVSEAVSPLIVGQFNELKLKYASVIKGL